LEEALKPKILVVDDEHDICKVIQFLLEREGYSVVCACSGEEAIEAIHKDNFNAILTDWKMDGVDGMAVLKKAKEINPITPVIIMTAFASHESAIEATRCGAAAYVIKPFLNEELKQTLRIIVERNRIILEMMKNDIGIG
jgi:DNA-binding NtrC family response regulator